MALLIQQPVEGLCNRLWVGMGFSIKGDILWGTRPLATQLAQEEPVALGIGSVVGGFQQEPPLVLSFLVDVATAGCPSPRPAA